MTIPAPCKFEAVVEAVALAAVAAIATEVSTQLTVWVCCRLNQVCSITQLFSVGFSQTRIGVQYKNVFLQTHNQRLSQLFLTVSLCERGEVKGP